MELLGTYSDDLDDLGAEEPPVLSIPTAEAKSEANLKSFQVSLQNGGGNNSPAPAPPNGTHHADPHAAAPSYPFLDELPPVVTQGVKPETLALLGQYLDAQRQHGFDLTASIQSKKDFGNPAILTKVVAYFQIDELGSNYPQELFDPKEIARRNDPQPAPPQQQQQQQGTPRPHGAPVKFVAGAAVSSAAEDTADGGKKRKSRWGE